MGEYSGSVAGECGSETLCTADSRKWGMGAVCANPELSKKTKKAKAEHPTAKAFAELMAETKAIMHDPVRKAEWQARYEEAVRKARKYNKPIQGRLYDYIKHELSEERKQGVVP